MLGQYHVVYMRFWLCSVNNPDAGPGGYLEWVEPLPFLTTVYKPSPDLATPALDRHVQIFQKPYEHSSYQWVENLPNLFKEHGLEVLATDQHPVQDQYRAMWGQSNLAGLEDIVNESIVATESEGIRKHQAALEAEMKTGANLDNTFFSVVGRRPS
ncbi:MAG: hypothetical protein M1820_009476 [Bogoriella megaspora]|nr:MAG: hypothetical protein M1820_009476 [Bogoriella megaspora]